MKLVNSPYLRGFQPLGMLSLLRVLRLAHPTAYKNRFGGRPASLHPQRSFYFHGNGGKGEIFLKQDLLPDRWVPTRRSNYVPTRALLRFLEYVYYLDTTPERDALLEDRV